MRLSFISLLAVGTASVSGAVLPKKGQLAPALPLSAFNHSVISKPLTLEDALRGLKPVFNLKEITQNVNNVLQTITNVETPTTFQTTNDEVTTLATCTTPRIRVEWDNYSQADRQAFVNGIQCLLNAPPSGSFPQARNRYEDLVALHQNLTPNIHGNAKFLLWHRYYLWVFEDVLREECGFNRPIPWFDERKYSGRFSASSIFSNEWFGAIALGGRCVTNGQFAGLTLNVGPGTGNTPHCLARNGNGQLTANTNSQIVNACNARTSYADMASCAEGGAHAWGHNGIGAVMMDTRASPGDPVFFLHHAFIDRNFRVWQNANPSRITTVNGNDANGAPLTLGMTVWVNNIRPTVTIGDILNTVGDTLCYRYDY